jgi:hypothetical protein
MALLRHLAGLNAARAHRGQGVSPRDIPTLKQKAIELGGCAFFAAAALLARRFSAPRRS